MKTERIFLHNWQGDPADTYLDIPWPLIHKIVGLDEIKWLKSQEFDHCQMILEKTSDGWQSLWAEFYHGRTRTEYALRFGK